MDCSDVQDQLSAYLDGELTSEVREAVSRHFEHCQTCAADVAAFRKLSEAVRRLPTPDVAPPAMWAEISAKLDGQSSDIPGAQTSFQRKWFSGAGKTILLAALVLLILGSGIWVMRYSIPAEHEHSAEFVAAMDHYLTTLSTDPEGAEQFLLKRYDGKTVEPEGAIKLVGYRPAVAEGLPDGYSLASTSVLKMPCCVCVKAVCNRDDGSTLVLFEHDDEKTEWFGDRSSNKAMCGDKECCLVDLDSTIAATWKRGSRSLTAVGVRDINEVNTLVSWLDNNVNSNL